MGGGRGPRRINLSSPSGIIHDHLIVLVRHKQAQMCLQSDPKRYEQFSMKVLKYFEQGINGVGFKASSNLVQ